MKLSIFSPAVLALMFWGFSPAPLAGQTSRAADSSVTALLGVPAPGTAADTSQARQDAAPEVQEAGATRDAAPARGDGAPTGGPRLLGVPSADPGNGGDGSAAPATREYRAWAIARLFGYSGKLRAAVIGADEADRIAALGAGSRAAWVPVFGGSGPAVLGDPVRFEATESPDAPGIYILEDAELGVVAESAVPLAVITTAPFELKRNGYINGYHVGRYPAEGSGRTDRYAPPAGFIEVTPENQDFRISEHFRLRQFLTKDQGSVWPKYVALDLRLIDKLELVIKELNAMGVRADAMHVMSGFRTPQYNGPGGDGRAALSRHTYGDAADVWVDSDGDGYMDDLNGDGRADILDARVIMAAVDRVERRYPELVGGAGVYVANSAHGPFIHIDVRGSHARW